MVGDFIICLLTFFNIFIYFYIYLFFIKKKTRSPERGPEGGPKRSPKGGSRREGPRFVYTQFGEHERGIRVARGAAESNSSLLSALQTSQVLNISTYALLKHELIVL